MTSHELESIVIGFTNVIEEVAPGFCQSDDYFRFCALARRFVRGFFGVEQDNEWGEE